MEKSSDLSPQQQLAVSLYMKTLSRSQAAKDSGYSSTSVFNNPLVKAAIAEQMTIRAERLRVGADWVLSEIVKLYHRTTQVEKVLDRDGQPTGEFRFDAGNAVKLLALAGRHVDVQAWDVPLDARTDDAEVMARLLRGRQRRRTEAELLIDSDDVIDDEEEVEPQVSFLQPPSFLEPEPPVERLNAPDEQLTVPAEPYDYEYTEAVHDIDDLLEPTPQEKLKLLMERWRTGKPPVDSSNNDC